MDSNKASIHLHSEKSSLRLQQIASLRAYGIGDHISLPQLVVCGDQSAGKSSVLEGITGLPFPRQDGVCTRFATEIILEHTENSFHIAASILPAAARSDSSTQSLKAFERRLESFADLPEVIRESGELMGIRGFGSNLSGPAFSEDVLRVCVSGPTGLHLTVVDLPGLISVPSDEQDEGDMRTVHQLVDTYAENHRTIILAVIQATNDIANQSIIQKSRKFDKNGQRTVGIITKPDLINKGTEQRIAMLAKNEDTTKLKLGYFILKNPDPSEIERHITVEQRHVRELQYFRLSPWKEQSLNFDRVGAERLQKYLQVLLDEHIERELPKVRKEINNLIKDVDRQIVALGEERPTTGHMRMFLSRLSMEFHQLVGAALHGYYHETDAKFFDIDSGNGEQMLRLRATIHKLNSSFSDYMQSHGAKRRIISQEEQDERVIESDLKDESICRDEETLLNEREMKAWVKGVYIRTRGKELPGNYNHVLLSELFRLQSSRWSSIAEDHVNDVFREISRFADAAIDHVTRGDHVSAELKEMVHASLSWSKNTAKGELEKLNEDEMQQPITYNHYYTDNVQQARHRSLRNLIDRAMKEASVEEYNRKMHISNTSVDAEKLLTSLQRRVVVNMDEQACSEALDGLEAYYKVARKTFVDNVCRQVVERHLVRRLQQAFNPETVAGMPDLELEQLATESQENVDKRQSLRALKENLVAGSEQLRRA